MQRVMSAEEIALRRKLLFRIAAAPDRFGDGTRMRISELVDPALLDSGNVHDGDCAGPNRNGLSVGTSRR